MPQTTALRRVSTFMVGALFAVVFVCSGAAATHSVVTQGESAMSAHTATSKAAARTIERTDHTHKTQSAAPVHLATSGPFLADDSPVFVVAVAGRNATTVGSGTLFTTSERAPPAL